MRETWVRSLGQEVPWRRKRHPTAVLLPRKSHGWRSLVSMGSQSQTRLSDFTFTLKLIASQYIVWASQVALMVKNRTANAGDPRSDPRVGLIPGSGRSLGEGKGYPLQYACLENPMDRGAWWAIVHRVAKSQTRLEWLSTHTHTHTYCVTARHGMN